MPYKYSCKLELSQDNCKNRQYDPTSRGIHLDGCPSCIHRVPTSSETQAADAQFEQSEQAPGTSAQIVLVRISFGKTISKGEL